MSYRDGYMKIYNTLEFSNYSQDELDEFGRILVRLYNIHLCFIGYDKIKKYDFYKKDIYSLSEQSKDLVMGTHFVGREKYEETIKNFLETVGNFEISNASVSVKRGLQNSVKREMIDLRTTLNNKQGYAFWENL